MRAFGFEPGDFTQENTVCVWPDNWRAVQFFLRIGLGCWCYRGQDVMGLRYESLPELRVAMKVDAAEWADGLFDDIQTMEDEAVTVMRGIK